MKLAREKLAALVVLALAGCVEDSIDLDPNYTTDEVVGGTVTLDNPHIGSISGCTATLVAPNVIITAAHCVDFRSGSYSDTFTIRKADGTTHRSRITEIVSYSRGELGPSDITVGRLAADVPSSVATPAPLAAADPARGETITIYGYGCTRRGSGTDWQKRRFSFPMGTTSRNLCPGDSGGPVITPRGEVLRINSGYYTHTGEDIYGHVPTYHSRIVAQIARWYTGTLPGPGGGGGSTPDSGDGDASMPPPPPPPPADRCNAMANSCGTCTPIAGCGWCGASNSCVSVDASGNPTSACAGGFALNPPDCSGGGGGGGGGGDSCGIYAPFPEFTCRRTTTGFARCRPGGSPEFLNCPSGYSCQPGSRVLRCYR